MGRGGSIAAMAAVAAMLGVLLAGGIVRAADQGVSIAGFAFSPGTVTVTEGDTVTWTNDDQVPHTATGDGFDTESIDGGQTASITFDTAGTYAYACAIHPTMTGTVVVEAAAAPTTAPTDGGGGAAPTSAAGTPPATTTAPSMPPRRTDLVGLTAVLLAVFGATMLVATVFSSRRDRPGR
jgi:plastocyanin